MSEDTFEDLDSVDPTFDAEASERMDEDDIGEKFWECFVLLLDSDQKISLFFHHFHWKSFLSLTIYKSLEVKVS